MQATWVTRDGRYVPLGCMTHDHIRNALRMILDGRMNQRRVCDGLKMSEWALVFNAELRRRGQ